MTRQFAWGDGLSKVDWILQNSLFYFKILNGLWLRQLVNYPLFKILQDLCLTWPPLCLFRSDALHNLPQYKFPPPNVLTLLNNQKKKKNKREEIWLLPWPGELNKLFIKIVSYPTNLLMSSCCHLVILN